MLYLWLASSVAAAGTPVQTSADTTFCAYQTYNYALNIQDPTIWTPAMCADFDTNFNQPGCFCNKIAVGMLGATNLGPPTQAQINNIFALCGLVPKDCSTYGTKTYNGGQCQLIDQEVDYYRFGQAKKFSDTLLSFSDQLTCFDYTSFKNSVTTIFTSTATAYAGQGLGTYTGWDEIAEYFSLLSPKVNRGFLSITHSTNPSLVITAAPTGNFTVGIWVANLFANSTYSRTIRTTSYAYTDFLEITFEFKGCDFVASNAYVPANSEWFKDRRYTGVLSLTEMLYRTVNADTVLPNDPNLPLLGIVSICKQHTKYCTAYPQFANEAACLTYYKSLPRFSTTCGVNAIASGNSVTCRAKHQFMAAISPANHCPHLGKNSAPCQDTKCANPIVPLTGRPLFTTANWDSTMLSSLTNYAADMARQFSSFGSWRYSNYCGQGYTVIGSKNALVAASMAQLWAIDGLNSVSKWNGESWASMPGKFKQIAICGDEQVYSINSAGSFFKYNPATNTWDQKTGQLSTIACGFDGFSNSGLYGVTSTGQIFSYDTRTGIWTPLDGTLGPSVGSIAVGAGKVWGLTSSGNIYSRTVTSSGYGPWVTVPGTLKFIAASKTTVVGLNSSDKIYKFNGSDWILNLGTLRSIAANDLFIFGANSAGVVYHRTISSMS